MSEWAPIFQRLVDLRDGASTSSWPAAEAATLFLDLLEGILRVVERDEPLLDHSHPVEELLATVDLLLEGLRDSLAHSNQGQLLAWWADAADVLELAVSYVPDSDRQKPALQTDVAAARSLVRSEYASNRASALSDESEEYLTRAKRASEAASTAAGVAGSASLSEHFAKYAEDERTTANWFRGFTIAGILLTAIAVYLLPHPPTGDWVALAYRVAIVAALGALFAYLAKQGGQHRRTATWAKSIEVQLKSFPAFIEGAPEGDQGTIYRAFANRVLGSPPEKGKESPDETLPAVQVIDLLTTIAKRA